MLPARIPGQAWAWRGTALSLGVVLLPVVAVSGFASQGDLLLATARLDGLIVSPAALVAAMACYAAWRINPRPGLAWATIGIALIGSQELVRSVAQLTRFPRPVPGFWVLAADLSSAVVLVIAVTIAHTLPRRPDPAATGFALGALVAALRLAWLDAGLDLGNGLPRPPVAGVYVAVFVAVAGLLVWGGGLTPRIGSIPRWARERTALAIVLIGAAHLADYLGDDAWAHAAAVVGDTLGAVLLVSTYLAVLRRAVDAADRSRSNLNDELLRAERLIRVHRSMLHELNSTVAGISSASRLLRSTQDITDERRTALADMISAELGRLERLMAPPDDATEVRVMDLDETISTLVVSQEARDNEVVWAPSGLWVRAQPDAVAEVLNVLLDNAAKHGRSSTEVTVTRSGDIVEVAVRDDGPGVGGALRHRLFDWGARGPDSTGQGIGLNIAHDLAQRQGGYLQIRDSGSGGATFVLGLPHSDAAHPSPPEGLDGGSLEADLA